MKNPYKYARQNLLDIKPYKPGKPIEELKRELAISEVYKLASNENGLGTSPKVIESLKDSLQDIFRYPDSVGYELVKKLSSFIGLEQENFILGNGSDEIIVFAIRAFCAPDDEVIIANPTFLVYQLVSMQVGAKITYVPLNNFRYDLQTMKKKITDKTKLIFIANPDNPSGSYVTRQEVEDFMKDLPDSVLVFFDEAYFEYVTKTDYPNTLEYLNNKNVIVSRTFSKIYGLAGLRIGYAMADPQIIDILNRVREPFNVNMLAQRAALVALDDQEHVDLSRTFNDVQKQILCTQLNALGLDYIESVTNFILINVKKNATEVYKTLLEKGLIVRDMTSWGWDTFIRVTIGAEKENALFLEELKRIICEENGA